jgi:hypothetical protein
MIAGLGAAEQVQGDLAPERVAGGEFIGGRRQACLDARHRHAQLEPAQAVLDHRHRLAAPAVGAEGRAELALDVDHGQRGEQIPHRLHRVAVDGGTAEDQGVGLLDQVDEGVRLAAFDVVERDAYGAGRVVVAGCGFGAGGDGFGHAPRGAVGRDVEDGRVFTSVAVQAAADSAR